MWGEKTVSARAVAVDRFNCMVPSPQILKSTAGSISDPGFILGQSDCLTWSGGVLQASFPHSFWPEKRFREKGICSINSSAHELDDETPKIHMKNKRRDEPGSVAGLQEGPEMYVAVFCFCFTALQDIKLWPQSSELSRMKSKGSYSKAGSLSKVKTVKTTQAHQLKKGN